MRAQEMPHDRVSPEMVLFFKKPPEMILKDGQKLKRGGKGYSRRGTSTSEHTEINVGMLSIQPIRSPAYKSHG